MRKLTLTLAALLLTMPVIAAQTYTYDWADGAADYIGCFDTDMETVIEAGANRPGSEGYGLVLIKNNLPTEGYALGFLAAVWGLEAGDQVTASIWRMDDFGAMPYFRFWAHYNNSLVDAGSPLLQDMVAYDGNCMGNNDFGYQSGWEHFTWTWTIEEGNTGLVIDGVVYGSVGDVILVDDFEITVPDHASVRLPNAVYPAGGAPVQTDASTWADVKALFR
ncbi:MAG: hypothetical protein PHQ53_09555 [Candidatus Krumholzibacteria bacterium]|nr:hypothetical protein [Candidatus Krumholzibacteria bacterium]